MAYNGAIYFKFWFSCYVGIQYIVRAISIQILANAICNLASCKLAKIIQYFCSVMRGSSQYQHLSYNKKTFIYKVLGCPLPYPTPSTSLFPPFSDTPYLYE